MNGIRQSDTRALDQAASDMTSLFWGRTEAATKAIIDWNNEVARFVSDRIRGDIETLGRFAQCTRPQDVFEIEADWFRTTLEDYAKEASKLMEANRNLLSWAVEGGTSAATGDRRHEVGAAGPRFAAKTT